jgi:lipopolysaccharide biosynthesis regulator YciM
MKALFTSALIGASLGGVAHAQSPSTTEISYPHGSIGYEALMQGDNDRAILQILANERVSQNDPAKRINLGQAYARTGRTKEAAALFKAAMQSREDLDLVLADGRVMSSKEAARQALARLQTRVAAR